MYRALIFASLVISTSGYAELQKDHVLTFNVKAVCGELNNKKALWEILRSQLHGVEVTGEDVAILASRVAPGDCTAESLEESIEDVLGVALQAAQYKGVEVRDTARATARLVDADTNSGAGAVDRKLIKEVVRLGDKIEGLTVQAVDRQPINLQSRVMQLGSEIIYTYAAAVGRSWTPTVDVEVDGRFCGKKPRKKDDPRSKWAGGRCMIVELKEEGQFSCLEGDDLFLFFRTCYELTFAHEYKVDGKPVVKYSDIDRSADQLPSDVYLPMLHDAEKVAGVTAVAGELTLDRLRRVQRARGEQEYERTRVHIGVLGAITDQGSQSLVTAAALHLYLSEQPWLPGRWDLLRRTSLFLMYGDIDAGAAKAQTLGAGLAVDLARGFALSVGYARYTLNTSLDPAIAQGTEVQTGSGMLGLSVNSEIVSGNKQAFAGFFGI